MRRIFVLLFAACSMHAMAMDLNEELLDAAAQNDIEQVRKLIEHGADVNQADHYGNTALISAAWFGLDIARLLIDRGANVNHVTQDGYTALILACVHGHLSIARLLIEHRADIYVTTVRGATARDMALHYHRTEIVALIDREDERRRCQSSVKGAFIPETNSNQ